MSDHEHMNWDRSQAYHPSPTYGKAVSSPKWKNIGTYAHVVLQRVSDLPHERNKIQRSEADNRWESFRNPQG